MHLDELTPFIKQFRTLDVDGTGRLGREDLRLMRTKSQRELAMMRKDSLSQGLTVAGRQGPRLQGSAAKVLPLPLPVGGQSALTVEGLAQAEAEAWEVREVQEVPLEEAGEP